MTTINHTAPDADLIALGDILVSGIFAERAALADLAAAGRMDDDSAMDAACAPLSAVIEKINALTPSTMASMAVFRLAKDWVNGNLPAQLDRA